MRRAIGRTLGQFAQLLRDVGKVRRDRQFPAERMEFLKVEMQHERGLQPQGSAHDIRGHEGIAVAVAADPATHL